MKINRSNNHDRTLLQILENAKKIQTLNRHHLTQYNRTLRLTILACLTASFLYLLAASQLTPSPSLTQTLAYTIGWLACLYPILKHSHKVIKKQANTWCSATSTTRLIRINNALFKPLASHTQHSLSVRSNAHSQAKEDTATQT